MELAKCMKSAGLTVEAMIEYTKLYQQGNETLGARCELFTESKGTVSLSEEAD